MPDSSIIQLQREIYDLETAVLIQRREKKTVNNIAEGQ